MNAEHVSSLSLDLLHFDALSSTERARIEAHLAECERCRRDAEAARASREHCARQIVPRGFAPLTRRRGWLPWLAGAPVLAAAIVLLMLKLRPPDIAMKGAPTFSTYVRHDGQVSVLRDGGTVRAGDEIRFVAVSETLSYLLVCSVDGAGKASIYFPFAGTESGTIDLRNRVELPGSVILDDAPGPERVFALFSSKPITAADATAALHAISKDAASIRSTQRLPVAADAQVTLVFEKPQ
ncbi:MAG TPA: zf-HC2 domain-containing protein [Polyangia bacterium]|nr:zf-HC2 domain-containing protein [Polyangia bacterium]